MPSIYLFYIFVTALFTVLVLIPSISRLAVSIGIFDGHDERKLHSGNIPRLGGIAIFFAVLLATILFGDFGRETRGFLAGGVVIFLTGLTDDLTGLGPRKKLLGQFMAALIVTLVGGLGLTRLGNLFGTGPIVLGYFSIPFTVFAIVGVTNAINLLDGLDGLAAGVAVIAATAMGIVAYNTGNEHLLGICVALVGALIGFLKFNSYPAKIFMGDGGSLFIGYCLAVFSVHLAERGTDHVPPMLPVVILAVPIFDACFVMTRRLLRHRPISAPDRSHIHHRLMGMGLGHKATVVFIYGLSYVIAIYAVMSQELPGYRQLINLALIFAVLYCFKQLIALLLRRRASHFLVDDRSFLNLFNYRWMVRYSQYLLVVAKYTVMVILLLTVFTTAAPGLDLAAVAGLLILLTVVLILQTGGGRFLQLVIYFNGAFLVYIMENYGRDTVLSGVSLNLVSTWLFLLLFVVSGAMLFLRKKSRVLMGSPMEYFVLFIVIAIPLLPDDFSSPRHLLTVAAKSLILFLSYKMIFMLNVRRNRKIIVVTLLALLICAVRSLI